MEKSIGIRKLEKFKSHFDILSVEDIIPYYVDINDKNKNIFDGVKKYNKCKVSMLVTPKNRQTRALDNANKNKVSSTIYNLRKRDIKFDILVKKDENNNDIVYIRDNNTKNIDFVLYLDNFYPYKQLKTIVKSYINDGYDYNIDFEYNRELMNYEIKWLGKTLFKYELE